VLTNHVTLLPVVAGHQLSAMHINQAHFLSD
jgi:hypothetical protein